MRTVQLNSFDAYTDCPTREQRAWVGDGVVHQLVDLVTNEDWGLARNYVDLGNAARPDGILPMVSVGDLSVDGGLTIPDWSLSWTHGVHVQYMHDGDLERALHYLPTVQRILQWYANYVDEHGVIADVAEWNLVDWSSLMHSGRSSILTALWARSLSEFAEIHRHAGNTASAQWAQNLYEAAAVGFEQFWDPARGLYVDHIDDDTTMSPTSQAANAVAIASGLAPQERWDGIITKITDPALLVVRSWVGSVETGSYDFAKMREQMNGRHSPTGPSTRRSWPPSRSSATSFTTPRLRRVGLIRCRTCCFDGKTSSATTTRSRSAGAGAPRSTVGAAPPPETWWRTCWASRPTFPATDVPASRPGRDASQRSRAPSRVPSDRSKSASPDREFALIARFRPDSFGPTVKRSNFPRAPTKSA